MHDDRDRTGDDLFDLHRFVAAQEPVWDTVHAELAAGRKRTHWMWFVFPQLAALGRSATARHYGIANRAEARAYLEHPLLAARLAEATRLTLGIEDRDLHAIFGTPDDLKFRSSMTLFSTVAEGTADPAAAEPPALCRRALDRFCDGEPDPLTLEALAAERR